MKKRELMAFLLASATVLGFASCSDDDDEGVAPVVVTKVSPADAVLGSYADSLVYTVGTMSNGTIENDTLVVSKVAGKENLVDLHFKKYMGMGGGSSQLYIYNVEVVENNGKYALGISSDSESATKAKMTSSAYEVTKLEGEADDNSISLSFDFLIAAMNATFSNEYKKGVKIK